MNILIKLRYDVINKLIKTLNTLKRSNKNIIESICTKMQIMRIIIDIKSDAVIRCLDELGNVIDVRGCDRVNVCRLVA